MSAGLRTEIKATSSSIPAAQPARSAAQNTSLPAPAPAPALQRTAASRSESKPVAAAPDREYKDIFGQVSAPPTHQRPRGGLQPGCTLAQQQIAAANNGRRLDQKEHQNFQSAGVDLTHFELGAGGKVQERTEDEKAMDQMKKIWNKPVQPPACILDDLLYMAGRKGASEMDRLPIAQFTHVVFSLNDSPLATPYACSSSFFVDVVDALDGSIQQYFEPMCAYIEQGLRECGRDTRICIHCQKGQSRSGALTAAFVMKHCNWSLKQAFEHIHARKPDLRVNVAFIAQLQKWEKYLFNCDAPSLSLKEADKRGWCKCYFALSERGTTVNMGTNNWGELSIH